MASAEDESRDRDALARALTAELLDGYRYVVRSIGYRAKGYLDLITMNEGLGAAQILLRGPNTSDGFQRLWRESMLQHSLEAVVIKPEYAALFTEDELEAARWRLTEHRFDVEQYLRSLPEVAP